jgi:hypothetical protein
VYILGLRGWGTSLDIFSGAFIICSQTSLMVASSDPSATGVESTSDFQNNARTINVFDVVGASVYVRDGEICGYVNIYSI